MKELKFTITGTMFVPDDAEYEHNFENQIYSFKINISRFLLKQVSIERRLLLFEILGCKSHFL